MSFHKMSAPSYWHSPFTKPNEWSLLHTYIDKWEDETPDKTAYVVHMNGRPRESITFKVLKEKTVNLAAGLLELGLQCGDFVIITGITSLDWILCDLACARIGVKTMRCQMSHLTYEGLPYISNRNACKAIFFHPGVSGEFEEHLRKCIPEAFRKPVQGKISCSDIPCLTYLIGMSRYKDDDVVCVASLLKKDVDFKQVLKEEAKIQPDDILTCFLTSGSTGFPKAIPYTHYSLINKRLQERLSTSFIEKDNIYFNERSLAWIGGNMHLSVIFGITTVYVHPLASATSSDVDFIIEVLREERVDCGLFMQYFLMDILDRFESGKMEPLYFKWAVMSGEVIQEKFVKQAAKYILDFTIGYGTTESSFLASSLKSDPKEISMQYAGVVDHGVEVKIVNDEGTVVPMGHTGEVCFRSPLSFHGYLNQESGGMKISKDGWIFTNDSGCLHENGYLTVHGRKSDVISRGAVLIYPMAVERIILQFPGVKKVSVIGVPDRRLGQNVCAFIIPDDGVTLTKEDMLKRFDEIYKTDEGLGETPAYFVFVDSFPTNNGKIFKKELQKMAVKMFNL